MSCLLVVSNPRRFKRLRTPANVFIINLTICDFCACCLHPLAVYSAFRGRWSFGQTGMYLPIQTVSNAPHKTRTRVNGFDWYRSSLSLSPIDILVYRQLYGMIWSAIVAMNSWQCASFLANNFRLYIFAFGPSKAYFSLFATFCCVINVNLAENRTAPAWEQSKISVNRLMSPAHFQDEFPVFFLFYFFGFANSFSFSNDGALMVFTLNNEDTKK